MRSPVQAYLFATVILFVAMAMAPSTRAEMTEADRAGQRTFAACLGEAGGDEETCLEKLGRFAWYPRDEVACENIAARVDAAISGGNQAEYKDLYFNERCARLGMAHDRDAAKDGDSYDPNSPYIQCIKGPTPTDDCADKLLGRHRVVPTWERFCEGSYNLYIQAIDMEWKPLWKILFSIERCQRLGQLQLNVKEK